MCAAAADEEEEEEERTYLGVDREHFGRRYVPVGFSEMLDIGDERIGVGGHVCAEEARFVCDWVCHFVVVTSWVEVVEGGSFADASRDVRG